MRRKMVCLLLVVILFESFCIRVLANSGTIRVNTGTNDEVVLYRVGVLDRDHYRLSDEHGGGKLSFDDILSEDLAAWLARRSQGGISRQTKEGIAQFDGLSEGLYLVDGAFAPFFVSLPWDGDTWYLEVKLDSEPLAQDMPKTGDRSFVVISSWIMAASMIGLMIIGSRKKY